ncbi:S8 family serine peptidase [bacterium]|nr:S8 family serine peptidase [bacterium]
MLVKKLLCLLLLASGFSLLRASDFSKIDSSLLREMEKNQDFIPCYVVLENRITYEKLMQILRENNLEKASKKEKRPFIKKLLKDFANKDQNEILSYLQTTDAKNISSLWTNNVIVFEGKKETISAVSDFAGVGKIYFDFQYSLEQLVDFNTKEAIKKNVTFNPAFNDTNVALKIIKAPQVWDSLGYFGQGVLVANLDSGTDYTHPDIAPNVWQNLAEDANSNGQTLIFSGNTWILDPGDVNGIDDDSNGKIDDFIGWDFSSNDNNPMDTDGHGTSTAGQVCGNGASGTITGVAPMAKLMILRVASGGQTAYWNCQQYAMDNDADVITSSYSFKWYSSDKPNYPMFRQNTDIELALGIVHTNSTSNDGNNQANAPIPFNISAPGNCPAPWIHPDQTLIGGISSVIGCGNINVNTGSIETSSPYGPATWENIQTNNSSYPYQMPIEYQDYPFQTVPNSIGLIKPDVSTPGQGSTATDLGGGYASFGGTSSATPHTGGICALMLSANPSLTPQEIAQILMTTAFDLGTPGKDNRYGAGRTNAYAAVLAALQPTVEGFLTDQNGTPLANATIETSTTLVHSDSTGFYSVKVPMGTQNVNFYKFGFNQLTLALNLTTLDTVQVDTSLTFSGMGSFTGNVVDEISLNGVTAKIELKISVGSEEITQETLTDANGNFAFVQLPESQTNFLEYKTLTVFPSFNYSTATFNDTISITNGNITQLTFEVSRTDVLLVDDDGGSDLEKIYAENFEEAGIKFYVWDVFARGEIGADTLALLVNKNVVWSTGYEPTTTALTTQNLTDLEIFLNSGAKVLLTGTNVANSVSGTAFGTNFIGATVDPVGITNSFLKGLPSDPIGTGKLYNISIPAQSEKDALAVTTGTIVAKYGTAGNLASVVVSKTGANWKTVMTGFEASGFTTLNGNPSLTDLSTFLLKVYQWFEPTGTTENLNSPVSYSLGQNYPNPFNPTTQIAFVLPKSESLSLKVYNLKGQLVKTLFSQKGKVGKNIVKWNGTDTNGNLVSSGVYFYKVETESGFNQTKKMLFLK